MSDPNVDKANMAEVYDAGAADFQSQAPVLLSWKAIGRPALERALQSTFARPDLPTLRWLDEGSASGRIPLMLIEHGVPAAQIDGVEISPEQVALAQKTIPEAHFWVGNLAEDELPVNEYDVITRHMVDEHLDNSQLDRALQSTHAALKAGGLHVIVFTHPDRVRHTEGDKIQPDGSYVTEFPWGGEGMNYFREVDDYLAHVKAAGFTIRAVESLPYPPEAEAMDPERYKRYMDDGYAGLNVRLSVAAEKPAA